LSLFIIAVNLIYIWAENYLKEKTRKAKPELSEEEFEKFWKYHKPEIMHEGAAEAIQAYKLNK
jgi:hypothetical protein